MSKDNKLSSTEIKEQLDRIDRRSDCSDESSKEEVGEYNAADMDDLVWDDDDFNDSQGSFDDRWEDDSDPELNLLCQDLNLAKPPETPANSANLAPDQSKKQRKLPETPSKISSVEAVPAQDQSKKQRRLPETPSKPSSVAKNEQTVPGSRVSYPASDPLLQVETQTTKMGK